MTEVKAPKSARHRAFCTRVAAGEPLGSAWAASALDVGKTPGKTKANNVGGSRMAAKCSDYIAHLQQARANARSLNTQPVNRESIHALLQEVTSVLMAASKAASTAGADGIAQHLNKTILVHSGRNSRANARAPKSETRGPQFDSEAALQRILWCNCNV